VATCAGARAASGISGVAEVEKDGAIPLSFLRAGWGPLSEDYQARSAYRITGVVDSQTGERLRQRSCGIEKRRDDRGHPSDKNKDVARMGTRSGYCCDLSQAQKRTGAPNRGRVSAGDQSQGCGCGGEEALGCCLWAGLVDMEAAAVARLRGCAGFRFYSSRA